MTELKSSDVIHMASDIEHLNGFFLVTRIDATELSVSKPPNHTYQLSIINGTIEDITGIQVVHSATPPGIVETRNYVVGTMLAIIYNKSKEDIVRGKISQIENDMIDVQVTDGTTIYIDFKYVGNPDDIYSVHIDCEEELDIEDDIYYLPESHHRFTLEHQITDIMNKLLSLPKQTSKTIRMANQIVQRFQELRTTFSDSTLNPAVNPMQFYPPPHTARWIIPVLKGLKRKVYPDPFYSQDLVQIEKNDNAFLDGSYVSVYKRMLEALVPFYPIAGTLVDRPMTAILTQCETVRMRDKTYVITPRKWVPQVFTTSLRYPFGTVPERMPIKYYFVNQVEATRAFIPNSTLLDKISAVPEYKVKPTCTKFNTAEECVPSQAVLLEQVTAYSKHATVASLLLYLITKSGVFSGQHDLIVKQVVSAIQTYKKCATYSSYTPNPLLTHDNESISEWKSQLLLRGDSGSLFAVTASLEFERLSDDSDNLNKRQVQLAHRADIMSQEYHNRELLYNNRFRQLARTINTISQSPNQNLLQYILQKPIEERYNELSHFINNRTRCATETEDGQWIYCSISDLKLLPVVFKVIIAGYDDNMYEATLSDLITKQLIRNDSDNMVTTHGGFIVAPLQLVNSFDDMVRSVEFDEDVILSFHRKENKNTPLLVDVLSLMSRLIKVDISAYFNYIIHKSLEASISMFMVRATALMLTISQIQHGIEIKEKLRVILDNTKRFIDILQKYSITLENFDDAKINKELIKVKTYYEIQRLSWNKTQSAIMRVTSSSIWENFLPPPIPDIELQTHSIEIIQLLQSMIQEKPSLLDMHGINSVSGPFISKKINEVLKAIPRAGLKTYNVDVPFVLNDIRAIPDMTTVHPVQLPSLPVVPLLEPNTVDYSEAVILGLEKLTTIRGLDIPLHFIARDTPLVFLRTFIQHIAGFYPKIICQQHEAYVYPDPLMKSTISSSHRTTLVGFLNNQSYRQLIKFNAISHIADSILNNVDIKSILQRIQLPTTDQTIHEYEYYIYSIFNIYMEAGSRADSLIRQYMKMYDQEASRVIISHEQIQRRTQRDKASESQSVQENRNAMAPAEQFIYNFRQSHDIDEASRLGRLRNYNAVQSDAEHAMFNQDDNDAGDSGNTDEY